MRRELTAVKEKLSTKVVIYGLVDPRDGVMRYVGRTSAALWTRLASHKYDLNTTWDGKSRGAGHDKIQWLSELKQAGGEPRIKVLEEVDADDATEAEKRWVQSLFKAGVPLTNRQWRPKSYTDSPEWLRGYACALVELHRLSGQSSAVQRTFESSGISIAKLRSAGVDDLDLKELTKCTLAVAR